MECVVFAGLQGAGKSSFYIERFFNSHVRVSLDQLRTRNRERRLFDVCLETSQRCVVDNTNPTRCDREPYIRKAHRAGYRIAGYYFSSRLADCLLRNSQRESSVPEVAILSTAKKLERPSSDEGFDELWYVEIENGKFSVREWDDEV